MNEAEPERGSSSSLVVSTLDTVVVLMTAILDQAKENAKGSLGDFVSSKMGSLGAMIGHYCNAFEKLNVKTRKEVEGLVQSCYKDSNVQDSYEELISIENDWQSFLNNLDKELTGNQATAALQIGDRGPVDVPLIDVRSKASTSLQQYLSKGAEQLVVVLLRHFAWLPWRDHVKDILKHKDAFDSVASQVLVVSFGEHEGAILWLEEMEPMPLDMLIDSKRELYLSIGLTRSLEKTWSAQSLTYYAEQKAAGRKLPSSFHGIIDDPNQMGGDFIVDKQGRMKLVHPSQTPTDRPTVPNLLQALSQ